MLCMYNYQINNVEKDLFKDTIPFLDKRYNRERYLPIILNIGTDSCSGDSVGPLVGWLLEKKGYNGIVFGNLKNPVHALNLEETKKLIWKKSIEQKKIPFIIAIDSCLGEKKNIGMIQINEGGLKPGQGVGKDIQAIGNMHINGIVNINAGLLGNFSLSNMVLSSTRLCLVMNIAEVISDYLIFLDKNYFSVKK